MICDGESSKMEGTFFFPFFGGIDYAGERRVYNNRLG